MDDKTYQEELAKWKKALKQYTYLTNDEYDELTDWQERERSHVLEQIQQGKTSKARNEFFENLIHERLKSMTHAEKEEMAEQAVLEWAQMSEHEAKGKEKLRNEFSDFNISWNAEYELIFPSDEFDSLWKAYWEKIRKKDEKEKARIKDIERKISKWKPVRELKAEIEEMGDEIYNAVPEGILHMYWRKKKIVGKDLPEEAMLWLTKNIKKSIKTNKKKYNGKKK